jgi:hypothetical protein
MTDTPPRIQATDTDIGDKLDLIERWYWPPEVRGAKNVVPETSRPLPPLLVWAVAALSSGGDHRFVAEQESDGRLLCFIECGGAFNGYLDADDHSSNPLVRFDVDYQTPIRLNDLVVGAFFERFAFDPDEFLEVDSLPSDEHLIWVGTYLCNDEPIRAWALGNRLILDYGPNFDGPISASRPTTNPHGEVEAISVDSPARPRILRTTLRPEASITVDTFRPRTLSDQPQSSTATDWSDIYRLQAEMLGFEHMGTTTIPWAQLEPLWLAIVDGLVPTYGAKSPNTVHVKRIGADLGYDCTVSNSEALEQLRTLLQTASEH